MCSLSVPLLKAVQCTVKTIPHLRNFIEYIVHVKKNLEIFIVYTCITIDFEPVSTL